MHTPGLLSLQLHMFGHLLYISQLPPLAGDAAKGIGWMTGAQDLSKKGELGKRKVMAIGSSGIQLSKVLAMEFDNCCIDLVYYQWDGRVSRSFPKRIPFGGRWKGGFAEAVRWEARKMCSATRFAWI